MSLPRFLRDVSTIEIRIRVGKEKVPLRLVATSMSGQWLKVDMYKESLDSSSGKAEQFCLYGPNGEEQGASSSRTRNRVRCNKSALLRVPSAPRTFSISSVSSKRLWSSTGAHIADVGGTMPAEFFSATELVLGEDGVLVKQSVRPALTMSVWSLALLHEDARVPRGT